MNLRAEVGVLVGVGVATFVASLLALVAGSLTPALSALGFLVGAAFGVLAAQRTPSSPVRWTPADLGVAAVFGIVAVRQFGWLLVERRGDVLTWDYFNYGDLPLHLTYIRYLANGAAFWPENPVFTATRLQYPIGMDLFQAMLLQLGIPLVQGLMLVGLLASVVTAMSMLRWGGALAALAFVVSGGLGEAQELAWKNLFLALFVTQRGFLFALPAGLMLLTSWRGRLLEGKKGLVPAWVEGALWGVMPLFHLHTFLLVSAMFAIWALWAHQVREARAALAIALLPASLGVLLVTDFFRAASLVGWHPGWTIGDADPLTFFLKNFTLYPALVAWATVAASRRRDRPALLTLLPALAVWALLFVVRLAPWAWDNTKVMLWCYLLTLPAIGLGLSSLAAWARGAILLAWLLPGSVSVADATASPRHGYVVYKREELEDVCATLRSAPVDARVAVAPTFNHPVALCGHPLVAGYGGHLWTYGIEPRAVEERLSLLMEGRDGWEQAAQDVHARFLFWGLRELEAHPASARPWEASRQLVGEGRWGRLYDLGSAK